MGRATSQQKRSILHAQTYRDASTDSICTAVAVLVKGGGEGNREVIQKTCANVCVRRCPYRYAGFVALARSTTDKLATALRTAQLWVNDGLIDG